MNAGLGKMNAGLGKYALIIHSELRAGVTLQGEEEEAGHHT